MIFHVHSAKELFRWRKKEKGSLPQRGGVKDFEPDDSWLQAKRLEAFYEEELFVLGEPRVEKSGNLVQGSWDEKTGLVSIEKTAKFWMKMGFVENNHNWLYPEEALFLMEVNCLEVQHHGLSLSLQEAYNLFLWPNTTLSLEEYQVYAHLRRLGYVVLRHSGKLESTPYERKIKLDKHCAKKKRKHDRPKQGLGEPVNKHTAAEPSDAQHALKNNASHTSTGFSVNITHCRQEALKNTLQEEVIALDHDTDGSRNDMSVNCVCEEVDSSVACNVDSTKRCEEVNTSVECSVDSTKSNHWKGDVSSCFEDATDRVHLTNHQGCSSEKITGAVDECDEPEFKRQKLEKSFEHDDALSKADNAVLNRLSIIQPFQESFEGKQSNPVKLSFDVYLPNTTFKKTSPGLPDHRICVSRCLQPPDPLQLQSAVAYLSDNVPLHWAVVISGEISFFVFENKHCQSTLRLLVD
ncbi:hypothetical protein C0Q70_00040 [Pomacea canaliculata]|uniref:tRNA-splicing endonuclease subunit Sen54 N-terminal domain-containing protein n=1 Tax=Pomacea canaliculata TaxID=400727 RepID=A0A2T7PVN1_POMCA|nr:hypothetical protein C0Q70_00040 [Pomacea canaliculata]